MKITQYKKEQFASSDTPLIIAGTVDEKTLSIHPTYEGNLDKINFPLGGTHILLVKKDEIQQFLNGKNAIQVRFIRTKAYFHNAHWLTHAVDTYINSLVADEIKSTLQGFSDEDYVLLSAINIGQHFEYTHFKKEEDYQIQDSSNNNDDFVRTYTFLNEEAKEEFEYEVGDEEICSIKDILDEIHSWKISSDVFFVRHPYGTGFATKELHLLEKIGGYVFENFLIEE